MKIIFKPFREDNEPLIKPIPAIESLPNWYKKMSPFTDGKKEKYFPDGQKNLTLKRCNPLGDALGAGYFLVLENDLAINMDASGVPEIVWKRGGKDFVSTHAQMQISSDLIPKGFGPQPFKFKNDWSIQTPKGYSILITHPLNRNAEPFLTLSGVVDTDTYQNSIQLPFLIRQDFDGIIEAGTPIAQVIPFKRESWQASFQKYSKDFYDNVKAEFDRVWVRPYKTLYWKRKEYK